MEQTVEAETKPNEGEGREREDSELHDAIHVVGLLVVDEEGKVARGGQKDGIDGKQQGEKGEEEPAAWRHASQQPSAKCGEEDHPNPKVGAKDHEEVVDHIKACAKECGWEQV